MNYVMQLEEGGGQHLCHDLINILGKMANLVLRRGGGSEIYKNCVT